MPGMNSDGIPAPWGKPEIQVFRIRGVNRLNRSELAFREGQNWQTGDLPHVGRTSCLAVNGVADSVLLGPGKLSLHENGDLAELPE